MSKDLSPLIESRSESAGREGDHEIDERSLGDVGVSPVAMAAVLTRAFDRGTFGDLPFEGLFAAIEDHAKRAEQGDLAPQRAMLASQAIVLNSMFGDLAQRAVANADEHPRATELYMRLALKAQAQSRATIESLDRLVNGREQTVRHVHVDNRGGQAVIAQNIQAGGLENGTSDKQPHAISSAGPCNVGTVRCEDAERQAMPIEANA